MKKFSILPGQKAKSAFSVVEIIIVVVVISILATITIISYGQWRERVAETEVRSDLAGVKAAMEDYRNFNEAYPMLDFGAKFDGSAETRDLFVQSRGVEVSYDWGGDSTYCIRAASVDRPEVILYLHTKGENSVSGDFCSPQTPVVTVTPYNGTNIRWDWSAASCPDGKTAEYRVLVYREGWKSAWYGPYTSRAFTFNTNNEGFEYTAEVQARCVWGSSVGMWSESGLASTITPITSPGEATNFTHGIVEPERTERAFEWTAPTCGSGARAERRTNQYVSFPYIWGMTLQPGWLYGEDGWSEYGWYTPRASVISSTGPYSSDADVQIKVQYICVNATTGRVSEGGPVATSPMFRLLD